MLIKRCGWKQADPNPVMEGPSRAPQYMAYVADGQEAASLPVDLDMNRVVKEGNRFSHGQSMAISQDIYQAVSRLQLVKPPMSSLYNGSCNQVVVIIQSSREFRLI
jgi:hypothetical protein